MSAAKRKNFKKIGSGGKSGGRPVVPRSGAGRELASGNVSGAGFHESSRYGKHERRKARREIRAETDAR